MSHSPTTRAALAAFAALALAVPLAACGSSSSGSTTTTTTTPAASEADASYPVTVDDDRGEVTIDERPEAIVSLSPSLTEITYAVGAGDQVVAVDSYSDVPADAPTTDLSGFRPNVEAIVGLEPDLVLLARDRDGVADALADLDIDVLVLPAPESLDDLEDEVEAIAAATGHTEAGVELAERIDDDLEERADAIEDRDDDATAYLELSAEGSTATSDTFLGALLELAELDNVADEVDGDAGAYPQLSTEALVAADPDVIFIAHSDGSTPTIDELAARPGWDGLTAVQEGRVVVLDPDLASRWGPRVVELFGAIAEGAEAIPAS